jgi:hypothetical protein
MRHPKNGWHFQSPLWHIYFYYPQQIGNNFRKWRLMSAFTKQKFEKCWWKIEGAHVQAISVTNEYIPPYRRGRTLIFPLLYFLIRIAKTEKRVKLVSYKPYSIRELWMLKVALPTWLILQTGDNYVNQNCLITPQLNKTNLQLPFILLQNGSETSNKSKSKTKRK